MKESDNALYQATRIELIHLQVRRVLELIALASLVVNKAIFEENQRRSNDYWNPSEILKDIEKLNPNYYPKPIREVPSNRKGMLNNLLAVKDGFLTKEELISIHGRTGNILHARNPYKEHLDYKAYEEQISQIMRKIKCLLNCHQIRLLDNYNSFYLIRMKEEKDDRVHYYRFQQIKGQQ